MNFPRPTGRGRSRPFQKLPITDKPEPPRVGAMVMVVSRGPRRLRSSRRAHQPPLTMQLPVEGTEFIEVTGLGIER